jgi:hypothetical protein
LADYIEHYKTYESTEFGIVIYFSDPQTAKYRSLAKGFDPRPQS